MANRVVIQADIDSYAAAFVGYTQTPMQLGDVIINAHTGAMIGGKGIMNIATAAATFPTVRMGPTIWFDGDALGTLFDFRLTNGGSTEWAAVSNADNWCKLRPIPNTQLYVERSTSTNNGYSVLILDIKYADLDFETDAYPGLRDGLGVHSVFHRGTYGLWISGGTDLNSAHMLSIGVPADGHFKVKGVEIEHGFSALRFQGGSYDVEATLTVENLYMHDGITGEGFYLGATHGPPLAKLKHLNITNVIVSRRAAESIQIQHAITDLGVKAKVKNFVVHAGSTDYLDAFQPFQDSCLQWSLNTGRNYFQDAIIDGWASNGLVIYGSNDYPSDGEPAIVQNCAFCHGGGIWLYIHNSTIAGQPIIYRDIDLIEFDNHYFTKTLEDVDNYYIGANNGTDKHKFLNISADGIVKTDLFQNRSSYEILRVTTNNSIPLPEYVNSGWYESSALICKWALQYGNYFQGRPDDSFTEWNAGEIALNSVDGLEYKIYKCLTGHTSTSLTRPDLAHDAQFVNPAYWKLLTWDELGVRNDQPGWDIGDVQSFYPPDDFRLVAGSYHNLKGRGLLCNEPNTTYTRYEWLRSKLGSILDAYTVGYSRTYTPQPSDQGQFLCLRVKVKDIEGAVGDWRYSSWKLVS